MGFVYGPLGAWLPSLFPARVRYTGVSVAFNIAGVLGGALTPIAAVWLAAQGRSALGRPLSGRRLGDQPDRPGRSQEARVSRLIFALPWTRSASSVKPSASTVSRAPVSMLIQAPGARDSRKAASAFGPSPLA